MSKSTVTFEFSHIYPNFDPQKFWDFHVDHEWYSQSDIMQGVIELEKPGKGHPVGLGAVRKLKIGNINLVEDIVGFDPPKYFCYAVRDGGMPVNNYRGEFFFESDGKGLILRYQGNFDPKPYGINWLFKFIFLSRMRKMVPIWEEGYNSYYKIRKSS